jgi:hypothetical protein
MSRLWTLEIDALDATDQPVTLRYATHDYPRASKRYDVRLLEPPLYRVSASGALFGGAESSIGEAVLSNEDGALDVLLDYAVDGRPCRATLVAEDEVLAQAGGSVLLVDGDTLLDVDGTETALLVDARSARLLLGVVERLIWDVGRVIVRLRDPSEALRDPHPHSVYAGSNVPPDGVEGEEDDIRGRNKPRVYGGAGNMLPVLVNKQKYIYQYTDSTGYEVLFVFDRGKSLSPPAGPEASLAALEASTPAPGAYTWYEGYIKVGAVPEELTANAQSSPNLDAGDVFSLIVGEAGATVDAGDVTALNAFGNIRIWRTDDMSTAAMLDRIAQSTGSIWWVDSNNVIRMRPLSAPDASPSITIRAHQINRIALRATGSGENGAPIWRVRVGYQPIEHIQTNFVAAAHEKVIATMPYRHRWVAAEDGAVKTRHLLAQEWETPDSCIRFAADAQGVADTLLGLLKVRRDRAIVSARLDPNVIAALEIGTSIRVEHPRFGYAGGRNFVVVGHEIDGRTDEAELELWG